MHLSNCRNTLGFFFCPRFVVDVAVRQTVRHRFHSIFVPGLGISCPVVVSRIDVLLFLSGTVLWRFGKNYIERTLEIALPRQHFKFLILGCSRLQNHDQVCVCICDCVHPNICVCTCHDHTLARTVRRTRKGKSSLSNRNLQIPGLCHVATWPKGR